MTQELLERDSQNASNAELPGRSARVLPPALVHPLQITLRWFLVLIALGLGVFASGQSLFAQSSSIGETSGQQQWYVGYNGFRMLLEERGLTTQLDLEITLRTPAESVVVMFGDLSRINRAEWLRLRHFVAQGGCVLVASEQALNLPGVCLFTPGPVSVLSAIDQYLGFDDCIIVSALNSKHPLSAGLRRIIVNKSGWLSSPEDDSLDWTVIASLPPNCLPASASGRPVVLAGLDPNPDRGVLILSADQSLFSDGMIWHGDNSLLAIQTSDLLCRGRRKWLTVYNSGVTIPGYQQNPSTPPSPAVPPGQLPPIPPQLPPLEDLPKPEPELATMLKAANHVIDEVQESNILNETLRDRPRGMRPVAWLRTISLILLALFTLFVVWKIAQNRWHLVPNLHTRFMQSMYGVHSAKQLASSEFGSAVEVLSRDLCREITGSQIETEWLKLLTDGKGARVAALPRGLRKGLTELLGIATRGCRIHISRRKFQAIGRTIDSIRKLHRMKPIV